MKDNIDKNIDSLDPQTLDLLHIPFAAENMIVGIISSVFLLYCSRIFIQAAILSEFNIWFYIILKVLELLVVFFIVFFLIKYRNYILKDL